MSITYLISIDKNDNGTFSDLGDSITSDILEAKWHLGMSAPDDTVADSGQANILVRNHQQQFSPEMTATLIGKAIRIQSDDGTTIRTHFSGFINHIVPQAGNRGTKLAQIIAYTREYTLTQQMIQLPLLVNLRADEAIREIIDQVTWRYAILEGRCVIGRDSIGSSHIFPDEVFGINFDTGISVFEFIGDNWADGYQAKQAITQFTESEGGRFFFDREGTATFHNRHHLLNDSTISATFNDDMSQMVYDYGDVVNHIDVEITPRQLGDVNTILWSVEKPIRLQANSKIQLTARYVLEGDPVGALTINSPLRANIDYQAMNDPISQTQNLTSNVRINNITIGASATVLDIENRHTQAIYLTQLDLRGTALISGDSLLLSQSSENSIVDYGQHTMRIDALVISDIDDAIGLATWELQRRAYPRGYVRQITTHTRTHPTETLALSLYDRITISESQTGHQENYAIIREAHTVDKGGTRHQVTWLLEPSDADFFFIIGTHHIDDLSVILVPR